MFKKSKKPAMSIVCDLCNTASTDVYRDLGEFKYYRCDKCTGIFVHPKKAQAFYVESEDYLSDPEAYISMIDPRGMKYLTGKFEQHYHNKIGEERGRVLEIGSGVGFMSFILFARDWEIDGLELSERSAEWSRKYLRMNVQTRTIEDFQTSQKYKAFLMVEVLEHFLDAKMAINSMKKLAGKNTLIFGTTPNTDSKFWEAGPDIYVPSDHIFLFNKKSLEMLAKKAGFKKFSIEYFGSGDFHDTNIMFSAII